MSATPLRPPAGRQGPGAMPRPLVDAIDLALVRLVAGTRGGDRRSAGVGAGTELAQVRPYEPGDDVRHLDPAAHARTGQPHVRLHVPERTLISWILLDVSASMAFGTARRLKADVAEGVVLVLGRLAVRRAGAVGLVAFGAGVPRVLPPRAAGPGIAALAALLGEGVAGDGRPDAHALASALLRLRAAASRPGFVAIVSDFRDQDAWERPLAAVRARHTVLAVEVHDPREGALPSVGRLALVDPETGERIEVDTSSRHLRARFQALEAERRAALTRELRRLRVEHVALDTESDWLPRLGRFAATPRGGRRAR